jgi:hypothetical protein
MANSDGDQMWGSEFSGEDVAMMRVPTQALMAGVNTANVHAYVDLPEPRGRGDAFHNRFIGDHLLYGRGSGWGHAAIGDASVHVVAIDARRSAQAHEVPLPHGIDRIEPMGDAAVIVGSNGENLHFTSLDLERGGLPAGEFVQPRAAQGELRSHGFFFKPERRRGSGTLGLPIRRSGGTGAEHLIHGSAEVLFVDVDGLNFAPLGSLASDPRADQRDDCQVSCVDWYGNARPIFYRGRVFALLGYELVEGEIAGRRIRERDRVNMLQGRRPGERVIWKNL